ncbi:D-alanine--D-alanine ligase [Bartonella sp. DGB1]|uniref:D-alanine--D-alanine ligase n=1 Tax=Bartonella sp. DGB1 TaxID=3239807 RepID=UPI003525B33F
MAKKHIVILMGGLSAEREVSLASGEASAEALENLGYKVTRLDVDHSLIQSLQNLNPDIVLNMLHGEYGEDGIIQGILEYLQIAYSHSGVLSSALAMNKDLSKKIVSSADVTVAPSVVVNKNDLLKGDPLKRPYIIKPVLGGGSSVGVFLVANDNENISDIINKANWKSDEQLLVEKYIPGRELTCAVMGNKSLGVCEIVDVNSKIYDYSAKYTTNGSKHICPAKILPNIYEQIEIMSVNAHIALGCRGISRSDFRFNEDTGELIWLELNSQPGMTKTSLVPDIAKAAGISFSELLEWMVEDASCRR